jgi:hypothetical protein
MPPMMMTGVLRGEEGVLERREDGPDTRRSLSREVPLPGEVPTHGHHGQAHHDAGMNPPTKRSPMEVSAMAP